MTSSTTPIENLDPDGDLIMTIGSGSSLSQFRVSRNTLRLASPIWKTKLVGGKGPGGTANEVRMLHDSPEHMRTLLLLAHLMVENLPRELALDKIAELAKLCVKYQCEGVARDRVWIWMIPHNSHPIDGADSAVCWLWIGWTFGWRASFMAALNYLLSTSTPAAIEVLPKLPKGCKEMLQQTSQARATAVLDKSYNALGKLTNRQTACLQQGNDYAIRCELLRLGTITKLFTSLSLPFDAGRRPSALDVQITMGDTISTASTLRHDVHDELEAIFHDECLRDPDDVLSYISSIGAQQQTDATLDEATNARFVAEEQKR